jgi:hypothetical protein
MRGEHSTFVLHIVDLGMEQGEPRGFSVKSTPYLLEIGGFWYGKSLARRKYLVHCTPEGHHLGKVNHSP